MLPVAVFAVAWPGSAVHNSNIAIQAAGNYEPSGLVWNTLSNKLFTVSDDGKVTRMNLDGSAQEMDVPRRAGVGTDFEAITIVNPDTNKVYIGVEHPDSIVEYDWQTKQFGEKVWNLTGVMTGANNLGLEGLTFVPNEFLPEWIAPSASGGLFYTAIQRSPVAGGPVNDDYLIYAFDIDLTTSGQILDWWGIPVAAGTPRSDVSDLSFNADTGLLYVLYDGANRLIEMNTDGTVVTDYSGVPVPNQEGVAVITNYPEATADIYLASDSHKLIGWYSGYPVQFQEPELIHEPEPLPLLLMDDVASTGQGGVVDIYVLDNDSGEAALTIDSVDQPLNGNVQVVDDYVRYTADNVVGNVHFDYHVRDEAGQTGEAQVSIQVNRVQTAAALDDFAQTQEEEAIAVTVLANDDGIGALRVTAVSNPLYGEAAIQPDGTVVYTPDDRFFGEDTFRYEVVDDNQTVASADVYVTVTARPVVDVSSNELVSYLKFDGSGFDSSGRFHGANSKGDAHYVAEGKVNGAASFDGVGDYLYIFNHRDINLETHQKRSVSVWFKTEDVNARQVIYEEGAKWRGLAIYVDAGRLYVSGWNNPLGESNWRGTYLSTDEIQADTWHHVVLTLNGSPALQEDVFRGYLDGNQFGSGAGSQLWAHGGYIGIGAVNNGIKFHTGQNAYTGTHSLHGLVDELRIYNRALSGEEVYSLFRFDEDIDVDAEIEQDPIGRKELVMQLIFNDHFLDFSGHANNAFPKNGAHLVDNGRLDGAMSFDGIDDYLAFADSNYINMRTHAKRSVGLWFKPEDVQSRQVLYEEGGTVRGLNIYTENGRVYVGGWNMPSKESNWQGTFLDLGPVQVGNWYHVAFTLDGSAVVEEGVFRGYLNGQLVASGAGSQLWRHIGDIGIGATNNDTKFAGGDSRGIGLDFYHGLIDDVRVYNKALSEEELAALANM